MKPNGKAFSIVGLYVIALTLIVCSFIFLLFNTTNKIHKTVDGTTEYVYESAFDEIVLYLDNLIEVAKEQSQETADEIRDALISKYPNNNLLKDALDNVGSKGILDIYHDILEDRYFNDVKNYDNDIFIANTDGIIYDLNYQNIENGDTMMRLWPDDKDFHYNKELFDTSLTNLLEQNTGNYIVFEKRKPNNNKYIKYSTITKETLYDIYRKEGIEGFKNYVFLVPSYIYNHKDILGTSDFINGVKVKNYKIIIVQEFNLYDQINEHYTYLAKFDKESHTISLLHNMQDSFKETCTILSIIIIVFVLVLCCMYNYLMEIMGSDSKDKESTD